MMACCGPSEVARGWRRERDSLRAENARLQERGDDYKSESEVSFTRARRAEKALQGAEARDKLRGEVLERTAIERHKDAYPINNLHALAFGDCRESSCVLARAAIDISPQQAKEKERA